MICARLHMSTMRVLRSVSWALALSCLAVLPGFAATSLSGSVVDARSGVVPGATIRLVRLSDSSENHTCTDGQGQFSFANLHPGEYQVTAELPGFAPATRLVTIADEQGQTEALQFVKVSRQVESVMVKADVNEMSVLAPDPGQRVFVSQDLLDANPGRPGVPVSIPGYPVETASSGIKAPQYFAPGVAGDHGE